LRKQVSTLNRVRARGSDIGSRNVDSWARRFKNGGKNTRLAHSKKFEYELYFREITTFDITMIATKFLHTNTLNITKIH